MNIPSEVLAPVMALVQAIIRLVTAQNNDERIEALMVAAEDAKAQADALRFGSLADLGDDDPTNP